MSEIMAEEKSEKQNNESENENSLASSTMSAVPTTTTTQPTSEISKDVSTENLLKTLLSTSTALSSSIIAPLSTTKISATVPAESMITKEVNDTQLNLKKILYEPDKEAEKDKDQGLSVQTVSHRNTTDVQTVDDDDRLVIDISDDEHDIQKKKKKKAKSMPLLEKEYESNSKIVIQRIPKSITYNLETTGASSSCVKIDILATSTPYYHLNNSEMPKTITTTPKHAIITLTDELNILNHEIDKQINKKTNDILELVKDFLGLSIGETEFQYKMHEIGSISVSDFSLMTKKLIKRHKFESNPNQKDFMKMKALRFPTSSRDLINYFGNLIPTMNKDKFVQMIKFYEIIVKEMLNLNKTKILQYLIDFMIQRKNAQLDMLSYNYESCSSPNFKQKVSSTSSIFETPDSTQNTRIERKNTKLNDTSYNFVIRSDPIYLTAGSTFMTNHRDVIKCRSIPYVQTHSFEKRPFDNNILRGRRVIHRITSSTNEQERIKGQSELKSHLTKVSGLQEMTSNHNTSVEIKINAKCEDEILPIAKPPEPKASSPILVESDTASSSPPSYKIIKPAVMSPESLEKAFKERVHIVQSPKESKKKFEFPKLNSEPMLSVESSNTHLRPTLKRPISLKLPNYANKVQDPLTNGQISIDEIKTLNQNGTEIIPTPMLRNKITARRKTIDIDRAPIIRSPVEVKKINIQNSASNTAVSALPATKTMLNYILEESTVIKPSISKILKRRQSCHERIYIPATTSASNNIEKKFMDFMNGEYESKKRERENKRLQIHQLDEEKTKQSGVQSPSDQIYPQQKRVRFLNEEISDQQQRSPQQNRIPTSHFQQQLQHSQAESQNYRSSYYQSYQNSIMQQNPKFPAPIDYNQYQIYFERLRERGFIDRVETLKDRDGHTVSVNRPLELVSHVPPERYLQHSESSPLVFTSPKSTRHYEKSSRTHQRTPIMTNDEKATLVAYNQLQSLHRDPTNLSAQQYSEHLKQLHQLKQTHILPYNSSQGYHQEHQNQLIEERESFYKNTQPNINSQESSYPSTSSAARPSFQFSSRETTQGQEDCTEREYQSLQRKLKLKAKTATKYIEPSQLSKPLQSTPRSTYYSEPYSLTAHKKPPTPTQNQYNTQERSIEHLSSEQLSAFYNLRNESALGHQFPYQWMLAQAQQQQQQQNLVSHNQPARPIPRPAIPASFGKLNGIPSNHNNVFSHSSLQAFSNQQSDYRYYYPKNF